MLKNLALSSFNRSIAWSIICTSGTTTSPIWPITYFTIFFAFLQAKVIPHWMVCRYSHLTVVMYQCSIQFTCKLQLLMSYSWVFWHWVPPNFPLIQDLDLCFDTPSPQVAEQSDQEVQLVQVRSMGQFMMLFSISPAQDWLWISYWVSEFQFS